MWTHVEIGFYEWRRASWDVHGGVRRGICFARPGMTEDGQIRQISAVLIREQKECL